MIARTDHRTVIRCLVRGALVPAGAFAVHQLRFMLAFGSSAGMELTRQGHSYLHSLVPWIVSLLAVAIGGFLWGLGRALRGQVSIPRYTLSLAALWIVCSACLVGIYIVQEFLEGLFATGHPAGLVGIFGYGGWWSIPVALCIGLVLAAIFHGARWVLEEVAERSSTVVGGATPRLAPLPHPADAWLPPSLAAGRGLVGTRATQLRASTRRHRALTRLNSQ